MSRHCRIRPDVPCSDPDSCWYTDECKYPLSKSPAPVLDLVTYRTRNKVVVDTSTTEMVDCLDKLLANVKAGKVTGFVMGVDEKDTAYTVVENMRGVVLRKD